ncbi:Alpha-ketoglutarate-dependent sulfonate dioxygenase [Wickerhamomyces ciferrii]|uniref:Alpha-ketoglutarate-dependent sulfonate dioxygenase n=1 Tax=Wickerhamomyces ciferrii (strain ATCC 14091 / BCRC 22168 / CBS 111 / JCM 3599 / NBRC 0793 / NRRL Y-1031 F-60-10) TaxID=1206466 RepID=K0KHS4_WICCF|nr:Alpha-ketoglutarate-dependent sulfonate dioxygenase [Wickerhamomyces ciferrii]CCH40934.1 Alpha-ketoglutarate-dependent sulfonate dioxygenase [Wickerhamomyces ciferrii]
MSKVQSQSISIELKNPNGVKEGYEDYSGKLPSTTRKRLEKYGIDLSKGYPKRPNEIPLFLDDAYKIRNQVNPEYVERGIGADPEKKALFSGAKQVVNLTKYIGTEIIGLQLQDLNEKQLDELALLIAERVVVVFRDQDLSPQKHLEIGSYYGEVEVHPLTAQVLPGSTVVWDKFNRGGPLIEFQKGASGSYWHTDLDHEFSPAGITHLHLDSIPSVGGDTGYISGYAAFDKLSPSFQKFLEGKKAIHKSAHRYYKRDDLLAGPQHLEREHDLVVTHPVTGWKSLFVNPAHVVRIVGLERDESDLILKYLNDVFAKNLDIQVRINWQGSGPGEDGIIKPVSVLWDNRISQHVAIPDYNDSWEGSVRHAHRVTSLSIPTKFDPESKSQREALGLDKK